MDTRLTNLFQRVALRWKWCVIRPVHFEKVVAMCQDDNASESLSARGGDKNRGKSAGKSASKSKTTPSSPQNGHSGGAKAETKLVSAMLTACIDILLVLVEVAPQNPFLANNSHQWKVILSSCFNHARQPGEDVVRGKLRRCLVKVLSSAEVNSQAHGSLVLHINVLLEKVLVDAEADYRKSLSETHASSEAVRQAARSKTKLDDEGDSSCPASFALEVIDEVCNIRPAYFKTFLTTTLNLASTLVKKHIAAATAKVKQGGAPYVPQSGAAGVGQMYHTPVEGIISAGTKSAQLKEPYPATELKEFDQTLRSTAIILRLLGNSDLPYSFTLDRKKLFQIISDILDSSNNVQLLMGAVRIVGKWLLSDLSGGPLKKTERNSLLWKIASFNTHGLPDVVSQPLADLVAHYVISLLSGQCLENSNTCFQPKAKEQPRLRHLPASDDMIIGRSLVACLLTANHSMREQLLTIFASQCGNSGRSKRMDMNGESGRSECSGESASRRSPLEVLWQLFHSDFEGLGGRSWIVLFVELLLAGARTNGALLAAPAPSSSGQWLPSLRKRTASNRTGSVNLNLEKDYSKFRRLLVDAEEDLKQGGFHFLVSLRRLAHGDVEICQYLFETLLPAAWKRVPSDGMRLRLVPAIESLLSRPFHSQFLKRSDEHRAMNVIRSFLNAVSLLVPLPMLDVDLLVSLAENYNCWYEVVSLLEQQHLVLGSNSISSEGDLLKDKTILALRHCHRQLGESTLWMSLALKSCNLPESKRAVSLDIYGRVKEATEAYSELAQLAENEGLPTAAESEMDLWEERWVELQREQCQLDVVAEYSRSSDKSRLQLECAWKQQDWDRVRALSTSSTLVAAVEAGDPSVKMLGTLLAVADGKLSDVEHLHAQTAQLCLYKWQLLPELTSGSLAHASLLQFFHRLVEVRESGQIMVETSNHSNGKTLPDLKNLLK